MRCRRVSYVHLHLPPFSAPEVLLKLWQNSFPFTSTRCIRALCALFWVQMCIFHTGEYGEALPIHTLTIHKNRSTGTRIKIAKLLLCQLNLHKPLRFGMIRFCFSCRGNPRRVALAKWPDSHWLRHALRSCATRGGIRGRCDAAPLVCAETTRDDVSSVKRRMTADGCFRLKQTSPGGGSGGVVPAAQPDGKEQSGDADSDEQVRRVSMETRTHSCTHAHTHTHSLTHRHKLTTHTHRGTHWSCS